MATVSTQRWFRVVALALVLSVGSTACGGDDDTSTGPADVAADSGGDDAGADTATGGDDAAADDGGDDAADATGEDDGGDDDAAADDGGGDDGAAAGGSGSAGVVASAAHAFGQDHAVTGLAVAPDGSAVAVAYAPPPEGLTVPGEIVVYDATTGAEQWRATIADAGFSGIDALVWTDAGVSAFVSLAGQVTTFGADGAVVSETVVEPFDCAQFLNGAVDAASSVVYTVAPGSFCRLDVVSGAASRVAADAVLAGALGPDSIRFDAAGALVATVDDEALAPVSIVVDPATLAPVDGTPVDQPPLPALVAQADAALEEGNGTISRENRVAVSADGSTAAAVQPDRVDIIR